MSETPPPPPIYSPDGKFWWDGARWVPVQTPVPDPGKTPVNRVVTYGCGCLVAVILLFWALTAFGALNHAH